MTSEKTAAGASASRAGAASAGAASAGAGGAGARRELVVLLLGGAAGAGLVLLASRQRLARVVVTPPHPLPATATTLSGQDLLPLVAALAVAALASLAAVLATRGLLRRITGLITAALGAGIAIAAAGRITAAAAMAAAGHANISPASGAGGGTAPGSTTAGTDTGQAAGSLTGFPAHVIFSGSLWRVLMLVGAAVILAAGLAFMVRATRLPVMSARYDRAGLPGARQPGARQQGAGQGCELPAEQSGAVRQAPAARMARSGGGRSEAASMWESLTAGADPTARPDDEES
jgi:uncharacterized membrane protein (TIGR02234 family)